MLPFQPTKRLALSLLAQRHRDVYCSLFTDAGAMRLIAQPMSPEEAEEDFRRALHAAQIPPTFPSLEPDRIPRWTLENADSNVPWARRATPFHGLRVVAELAVSGEAVALYGLHRWDKDGREWEMGVMAPRHTHGRGYAVEGMHALAEWLVSAGAERILLRCRPDNLAACRVARGMGFRGEVVETNEGPVMLWVRLAQANQQFATARSSS